MGGAPPVNSAEAVRPACEICGSAHDSLDEDLPTLLICDTSG
jgi:hypothetical protein